MKRKSSRTYQSYSPSPRSAKQINESSSTKVHLKDIYVKNKRNSVHYVNLKQAIEKLETVNCFYSKMSTFVNETSFQFKE